MRINFFVFLAFFIASCTNSKYPSSSKNENKIINSTEPKIVYIKTDYSNNINKELIDTNVVNAISMYNASSNTTKFILTKDSTNNLRNVLVLSFSETRFATKSAVNVGYIISAIGLVATPLYVWSASNGNIFLAFWFLGADKASFNPNLSKWDYNKRIFFSKPKSKRAVVFENLESRKLSLSNMIFNNIYNSFRQVDKGISK